MIAKTKEKEKSISLRKKGFSYNEILKEVPVAKSSLSLWLRSVGLAKREKQRLTKKRREAQEKGAQARREQRIRLTEEIKKRARKDINVINKRDLWMIGTALYWAEGSKEKTWDTSVDLKFSNSDSLMIKLYLKWLKDVCFIIPKDITYELYIHDTANWKKARKYWVNIINISYSELKVYFKHNKIKTKRKNIKDNYNGVIMVRVRRSTNLNRKIQGWIESICQHCEVV
ncbi:MAG: hypothetical protein ABH805_00330 [Candidatus Nealsonbacteria bacterium]